MINQTDNGDMKNTGRSLFNSIFLIVVFFLMGWLANGYFNPVVNNTGGTQFGIGGGPNTTTSVTPTMIVPTITQAISPSVTPMETKSPTATMTPAVSP